MEIDRQPSETISLSEALLSAMDALPFGLLWVDCKLRVTAFNAFMRQRLVDPPPQAGFALERILAQGGQYTLQAFRQALQDEQPATLSARLHREIFRLATPPGLPSDVVPQSVSILPTREAGRLTGLLVVVQDVSDRVLAEKELNREIEKLTFLHQLDLALSTLDPEACIQILVTSLRSLFRVDFASLLLIRQGRMEVAASDGLALPAAVSTLEPSVGLIGWVVEHRRAVNVPHVQQDPRYYPLFDSIRSEMAAPLLVKNQCLGVINLESSVPEAFSAGDLNLLEMVAFSAAAALYNAQVHTEADNWRSYYQAVVNQTGDVIYTVDRQLCLTGANAAWDQFALENGGQDWVSAKLAGRSMLEALGEREKAKWRAICASLIQGEIPGYYEQIPCHAPGIERWLALRAAPLRSPGGQIEGLVFSTHDVSRHVQSERRLRTANQQYEILLNLVQLLSQNLPNQNVPQVAVEALAEVLQADVVTINRYDPDEQCFKVLAAQGASERHVREFTSSSDQTRQIIDQYGASAVIYDLQNTLQTVNLPIYQADGLHGVLYAVIEHQGRVIGSLNLFTRDPERRFSSEDQALVRALAPQIGLALENARLYDQLQRLAVTDGLTGLANRRQLDDLLAAELARSQRYHHEFSILMIDLDHFKCFNDTFGHALGDELLVKLARLFRKTLRFGDAAARYGGDEFTVILPETGLKGASCIAERLRQAVAEIEVPLDETSPCPRLTLSIGVAAYPQHAGDAVDLLRCADQALYRAKRLGRDRTEAWVVEPDAAPGGSLLKG